MSPITRAVFDAERPCILCGTLTTGSIGAAGIRWPMICAICKAQEDAAADASLCCFARAITEIERATGPTPTVTT